MKYVYKVNFCPSIHSNDKDGTAYSRYYSSLKKAKLSILSWWTNWLNNNSLKLEFTKEDETYYDYDLIDYKKQERINTYTNRNIGSYYPLAIEKIRVNPDID